MTYGLSISGTIRVFAKTKTVQGQNKKKYDITDVWFNTSEKQEDGSYFNISTNLIFNKDLPKPENNTLIDIKEAFPVITGQKEYRKIAYYVRDYVVSGDNLPF